VTAADKILQKALVGSGLDTEGWSKIQAGLRDRAFFSATVEDVRILHAMRKNVYDVINSGKSPSEVRRDLRQYLQGIGHPQGDGGLKDLYSKKRLDVMVKTNADQARGYATHLRATTAGAIMAFPAYELVRAEDRKLKRDWSVRWRNAADSVGWDGVSRGPRMVALKTSPVWAALSRFGNPFPPFDFNSGMGVRDVAKSVCREIGLLGKDEQPEVPNIPDFNGKLYAELPDTRSDSLCGQVLRRTFGDQIDIRNGKVAWQGTLIQDLVSGKVKKARLGTGYNGDNLSLSHQFFVEHGSKHLNPDEPYEHLAKQDFELLPTLWRSPDRIKPTRDPNRDQIELDMIDGGILLAIVDRRNGLKSIQKRKGPGGSIT